MFDLNDLHRIESLIITLSDQILLPYLNKTEAHYKNDGSIVTEADIAMQQSVEQALKNEFGHHIPLLGEEYSTEEQTKIIKTADQFWVFDPLDGTTNFHATFPIFCTSLALISEQKVQLGITYDPIRKECFSALRGEGFYFNQQPFKINSQKVPTHLNDSIALIDFKRLPQDQSIKLIKKMAFKSQRNIGSSALEWAWLAMNRAHVSFHGGQKLWDYAAGSLLLTEAGGFCHDHEGNELYLGSIDVRPIVAGTSKALCLKWHNAIND